VNNPELTHIQALVYHAGRSHCDRHEAFSAAAIRQRYRSVLSGGQPQPTRSGKKTTRHVAFGRLGINAPSE